MEVFNNATLVVGAVFLALVTIYGFLNAFKKGIVETISKSYEENQIPVIELNGSVKELNTTVKFLNQNLEEVTKNVSIHEEKLQKLDHKVAEIETKVRIYHEGK